MSKIRSANKTLAKISTVIKSDQGVSFRKHLKHFIAEMDDAFDQDTFPFRKHLGASIIGRKCDREIFYSFRWSKLVEHESRLLRLFNRGHLEEGRFLAILKAIGIAVYHKDGQNQFKISDCNGHFGGSLDAVGVGVPDLDPKTPCLLEFKTAGDNPFNLLKKNGLRVQKHEHFVQMQAYMYKKRLNFGMYLVVNKNTDEIYAEIVNLDPTVAKDHIQRAENIITSDNITTRISSIPSWYECKFCDYSDICHHDETPHRNCRTCEYSRPVDGAQWLCVKTGLVLDKHDQLNGCDDYKRLF